MESIKVAGKVHDSVVDGPGLRYTLFVQGCPHLCEGCHNPETHNFDGGTEHPIDDIIADIASNPLISGLTLSGGEPLSQAEELIPIAEYAKDRGLNIWMYTGWTYEEIITRYEEEKGWKELLALCDVLIDGRFEIGHKSMTLKWKGSSNQRVIDLIKTGEAGEVIEYTTPAPFSDFERPRWG